MSKSKLSRLTDGAFLVACVVVAAVGALRLLDWVREPTPERPPMGAAWEKISPVAIDLSQVPIERVGTPKFAVVEFSDFECPFCRQHGAGTLSSLRSDWISPGTVADAYYSFPLERIHPGAFRASELAACADERDLFWQAHDQLLALALPLEPKALAGRLRLNGAPPEWLEQCDAQDRVRAQIETGRELGVKSTPTFFVGSVVDGGMRAEYRILGARGVDVFKNVLEEVRKGREHPEDLARGAGR